MDREEIRQRFNEQGYLLLEDVLDPVQDLEELKQDYATLLGELAEQWCAEGKISSSYSDLPFERRFANVAREAGAAGLNWIQYFDFSLPQGNVKPDTPIHLSEQVFRLLTNPKLLDVAEAIVGPEITVNPIHHVRLKPPESEVPENLRGGLTARTGWHQDLGVALPEADETTMLTVWLPITEATEENGCLCVIPGSHRLGLTTHCTGAAADKQLHIPDSLLGGTPVPQPMRPGSVLLLHRLTKHGSLSNTGKGIRWSFDLRFQPTGQPSGRPAFPSFVARSRQQPESVVTDWHAWAGMWEEARQALLEDRKPVFNRWTNSAPVCA
jgi:ectoine hydroxylase-related dioxygenase (phytanoyl-CoA dioxygenase family)